MKDTPEMRQKYAGLARRGILRSYLLRCGDEYCAFVRGFQYHDTYYYTSVGFAEPFAALSPGGVMLSGSTEAKQPLCHERFCAHQGVDAAPPGPRKAGPTGIAQSG